MTHNELRQKWLAFWKNRSHTIIPSASLVPEGDVTTLFTGSGMQPIIKYLLGAAHPGGTRLVNSQKSLRAEDIDEVGDNRHTTFFEMLGNWSLGDYFKAEQLPWIFEFLTDELHLDPQRLYVSAFSGATEYNIPKDEESVEIWQKLFATKGIEAKAVMFGDLDTASRDGMQDGRIFYYDAKKNWWSRSGTPEKMPPLEPGGPDSEIFFDFGTPHDPQFGAQCHPNCDCGRFVEIGNSVFMEYVKTADGSFEKLPQRNVDFGGGFERMLAAHNDNPDVFAIDIFAPLMEKLRTAASKPNLRSERIIADHLRAAIFLIADGVRPSNKERGYMLRRLIRRAVTHGQYLIGTPKGFLSTIIETLIDEYHEAYPEVTKQKEEIIQVFQKEQDTFEQTYKAGIKHFEKLAQGSSGELAGQDVFHLQASYGFPMELTKELAEARGLTIDLAGFEAAMEEHRQISRAGQSKKFGGHGLILDTGELRAGSEEELGKVLRLHTATHLLQAALRQVLGDHVGQKGSDISAERLRFDFTQDEKLTPEQIAQVEGLIDEWVAADLPMQFVELPLSQAKTTGALYMPQVNYPDTVKVYFAGIDLDHAVSKEFCGGPHVAHTGAVGHVRITKDEALSAGIRRIRAIVEH